MGEGPARSTSPRNSRTTSFIRRSSIIQVMAGTLDTGLYPLHHCKTLHLVRHGQGYHNVAGEKDHDAYMSYEFFDTSLTPLGWRQVDNLRKHIWKTGIASRIELVVTSPLMRTMQTAVGVFGGGGYIDGDASPPLMVTDAAKGDRAAITSANCAPFIANEWCREQMGLHPCDKRKNIDEYRPLFPGIDFSLIETNEDLLWKPDARERRIEVAARGRAFMNWLLTRKEKEIAVFSHSSFLIHTLGLFGNDCHSLLRKEIHKAYANCELRSFVIADRSAIGTNLPLTDFSGGIPRGPDVPSDYEDVKSLDTQDKSSTTS